MADAAMRTVARARTRRIVEALDGRRTENRHPLVATAMVLPLAALLTVAFGGWEAVITQASSVAGMLGR